MSKNPPSWLKSFAKKKAKLNESGTKSSSSASAIVCAESENEGIRGEEEDYMSNDLIPDVPSHRRHQEVEDDTPRSLPYS